MRAELTTLFHNGVVIQPSDGHTTHTFLPAHLFIQSGSHPADLYANW